MLTDAHLRSYPASPRASVLRPITLATAILVGLALHACSGSTKVDDPIATLQTPGQAGRVYLAAMQVGDRTPQDESYRHALRRIVVSPNYVVEARRAAYARLYEIDRTMLKESLEIHLPKLEALEWRRELCERIAADDWKELTPTLIRSWAQFQPAWATLGKDRPERLAIASMYGEDKVVDVLLDGMAKSNPVTQANLRARCWELLLLEGQEDRLRALLADEAAVGRDGMMIDLRRGLVDLSVLPRTREEILWLRTLCDSKHAAFMAEAKAAVAKLPPDRRRSLELRDIPVVTAAATHRPELLTMDDAALDRAIVSATGGDGRPVFSPDFEGHDGSFSERFHNAQPKLTWGDRAAMLLAIDALSVPELRRHLFESADRDMADKSTEHGGIIDLDGSGRYELVEYPSRNRGNDARYDSPQALMDALYTSLYHVHLHAQAYDNRRFAGPHMGDFQFAEATRANCLVFAFVDDDRLNVDFYRHGRVVVDLGTIERPAKAR